MSIIKQENFGAERWFRSFGRRFNCFHGRSFELLAERGCIISCICHRKGQHSARRTNCGGDNRAVTERGKFRL